MKQLTKDMPTLFSEDGFTTYFLKPTDKHNINISMIISYSVLPILEYQTFKYDNNKTVIIIVCIKERTLYWEC